MSEASAALTAIPDRQKGIEKKAAEHYEELIMKLAKTQHGVVTRENVVDLLGINPAKAYRLLKRLTEKEK